MSVQGITVIVRIGNESNVLNSSPEKQIIEIVYSGYFKELLANSKCYVNFQFLLWQYFLFFAHVIVFVYVFLCINIYDLLPVLLIHTQYIKRNQTFFSF